MWTYCVVDLMKYLKVFHVDSSERIDSYFFFIIPTENEAQWTGS